MCHCTNKGGNTHCWKTGRLETTAFTRPSGNFPKAKTGSDEHLKIKPRLDTRKMMVLGQAIAQHLWCPPPESNRHSLRNGILNPARLPVPPEGQLTPERVPIMVTPAMQAIARCPRPEFTSHPLLIRSCGNSGPLGILATFASEQKRKLCAFSGQAFWACLEKAS